MHIHVKLRSQKGIHTEKVRIGKRTCLLLTPDKRNGPGPAVVWIHGGGYILGLKEMVHMSRAVDLVKEFGAVVLSPGYRLALMSPYPAAVQDCYEALIWLKEHAAKYGAQENLILVGGESAGGGLTAAVCMMARDHDVHIDLQLPLYPMLDDRPTASSEDNHGRIWNTRRNRFAWKMYLRRVRREKVPVYAAPARQTDFQGLPPCYTFVGDGEPFRDEALGYVQALREAGIEAECDVYHTDIHAFDMLCPELEISQRARERFLEKVKAFLEEREAAGKEKEK